MPFATASDAARIFYTVEGSGPVVALSTPSFSSHRLWERQVQGLASRYRVVTWDYRGHGRSDAPLEDERYSLEQVVDDLRAVLDAAAPGAPAHLGGLSVGGIVSLSFALTHPERVRSLLLFNTGPGFKNPDALAGWQNMLERSAVKLEEVGLERYLEGRRATAELLGLQPESPQAQATREGVLTSSVEGLTRFARRVAGPVPNLVDRLADVAMPALILVGEKDEAFQRASQVMAAKLPAGRRVELPGAGHALNLDEPEAFAAVVERFLAEQDPA
ncbi:MAG: alpha/beta fold hydrolase [Deltaproteobacteria bacterium]|nr:alpha/beta fold hydrolase [Deltaproteobacteria bacterium]MBW2412881.1 alpha/beta fold hydrolase [Deltaproteobacteria bacterium]